MRKSSFDKSNAEWGSTPIDWWAGEAHHTNMILAGISRNLATGTAWLAQRLLVVCLLLVFGVGAAAVANPPKTAPLALSGEQSFYASVRDNLEYFRDPSRQLRAIDVAGQPEAFEPLATPYIGFGLTDDRIWLKWDATNVASDAQTLRIDMKRQYFTELELFEVGRDRQPLLLMSHSQEDSFNKRAIPSRFLLADVAFEPGETKTFLIGYRSSTTTFLPLAMGSIDGVLANHGEEFSTDLFLNGMLVAMTIYSLLMLPVIGRSLAASFSGYIAAAVFYVLVADGYPMRELWPDAAWINEPMNLASMLLMTALGLNFCRQLFHFHAFSPHFDRVLKTLLAATAACLPISFLLIGKSWFTVPAYLLPVIANICVCIAGVIAYRAGRIGALPFTAGALLVFTSLIYATIAHLVPGRFDLDATLDYGHFALLGECIAFALAILLRFLSIRRQRDEALAAKLEATEERLRLNERLVTSQRDFEEAKFHAEQGQRRLSEMAHDIRQPLLVLKEAVSRLERYEGRNDVRLKPIFGYLEQVASAQNQGTGRSGGQRDGGARERFPVQVVLDNIAKLYCDRALDKGITLKIRASNFEVSSNPISLMRIVGNLMDNALNHSGGSKVLLAVRKARGKVRIEIHDNGSGLSEEQVSLARERGIRSQASEGSGIGLSIVERICNELGHTFEFRSRPGHGSVAIVAFS